MDTRLSRHLQRRPPACARAIAAAAGAAARQRAIRCSRRELSAERAVAAECDADRAPPASRASALLLPAALHAQYHPHRYESGWILAQRAAVRGGCMWGTGDLGPMAGHRNDIRAW